MKRPPPDFDAILAAVSPAARAFAAEIEQAFGKEPGEWSEIPPMRTILTHYAALRLAADMMPELSARDALAEACELLGMGDDAPLSVRTTRPSDSLARTIRRWQKPGGQNVQPRKVA